MRGKGRIYRPDGRKVWMLAYYAPRPGRGRELVRESAKTDDEELARKRLETRMRQVRNAEDGINDFEGPTQKRVTVNELFDELLEDYETRQVKGLRVIRGRLSEETALRRFFGPLRAIAVTAASVDRYVKERIGDRRKERDDQPRDRTPPARLTSRR